MTDLNRRSHGQVVKAAASYSIEDRLEYYFTQAAARALWPMHKDERPLEAEILSRAPDDQVFYHGGPADLPDGEVLLQACVTGYDPRCKRDLYPTRTESVFVTTNKIEAGIYALLAVKLPKTAVYRVEPRWSLGIDVEHLRAAKFALMDEELVEAIGREAILDRVTSFTCHAATILDCVHYISAEVAHEMRSNWGML